MRRAAPAALATAGALGLLATFHTAPVKRALPVAASAPPPTTAEPTTTQVPADTVAPTTVTTAPPARAVTGPDIATRYGDVQVQVVMDGTRLIDVRALRLPFSHSRSQQISDQAGPMLRSEALQAQSGNIDLIGGATYTSDGYIRSLQAALDAAR